MRPFLLLGAVNGFLAVAFGAFGAHGLKGKISAENLAVFETAAHYHLIHALAMVAVGILILLIPSASKPLSSAGWLFAIGILLFSGSLYSLAITDLKTLGAITPLGGLCFLIGWALVAVGAAGRSTRESKNPEVR